MYVVLFMFMTPEKKEKINNLTFNGCEDILMGDVLHYRDLEKADLKGCMINFLRIVKRLLIKKSAFYIKNTPNTLFFCSTFAVGRKDQEKAFFDVANVSDNYVVQMPNDNKLTTQHIKYFTKLISWNKILKKSGFSFAYRLQYINIFFDGFVLYKDFEQEQKKQNWSIDNLVVFCDVHPADCFFVQKFKQLGKKTATVQHGSFAISYDSWAFKGSKSDVFLADGPHAKENAEMAGCTGNIIPVGSMHSINDAPVKKPDSFKTDVLGIVMNSSMMPIEDNREMIKQVQNYCREKGKKAVIKYHPGNNPEDYKDVIDTKISFVCEKSMTVPEFFDMIDVSVVCDSTVFTTALFNWIPSLLFFREGFDKGKYLHTEDIKFKDSEQLKLLMDKIPTKEFEELMESYRKYFLSSGVVKENYRKAFKEIGINND